MVLGLGITWVLDGLEVTLTGSISGALQQSPVLHFSAVEVGLVSSFNRPEANVTGISFTTSQLAPKRLELLL